VSVEPATFEETTSTAPISPNARAALSTKPHPTPQRMVGMVTRQKVCHEEAPSGVDDPDPIVQEGAAEPAALAVDEQQVRAPCRTRGPGPRQLVTRPLPIR
jgi:hypothetical protein